MCGDKTDGAGVEAAGVKGKAWERRDVGREPGSGLSTGLVGVDDGAEPGPVDATDPVDDGSDSPEPSTVSPLSDRRVVKSSHVRRSLRVGGD